VRSGIAQRNLQSGSIGESMVKTLDMRSSDCAENAFNLSGDRASVIRNTCTDLLQSEPLAIFGKFR